MKNKNLQTLEEGDWIERNYADWIRKTIPLYETIWARYIGNNGNAQPLPIEGLSDEMQRDREKFYQAHYSSMVALIHLHDICNEYQTSLAQANSVAAYVKLQRDIMSFMCFVGRVRDMMKKMDAALGLSGEVWKRFDDLYQQRSNYLHSPNPSHRIDETGLVSVAIPGGKSATNADWIDESRWSDSESKRFTEIPDLMNDTLKDLHKEIYSASSRFLEQLNAIMPNQVSLGICVKNEDVSSIDNTPLLSGVVTVKDSGIPAASGCFVPATTVRVNLGKHTD